jgi:ferredoxin--NADP+ reductase
MFEAMDAASSTRRAAIFGAGPAGFYAADQLLNAGFEVDLYDALPTPYGLVRAGVAPDHPKIKSVTRVYDKTARREGFRFFGGVVLGQDVSRAELLERYHAVVYAIGTATDNRLGIPGEDLPGSHPATEFVGWYNGHPDFADHSFDLTGGRAVVVGNGNVAVDVARMLVLEPDEVRATDCADHAIEALAEATFEEVVMLGRRGPAQAAFTNPELRELGELSRADVVVDPADLELDPASAAWLESDEATPTNRRNVEILRGFAEEGIKGRSHRVVLRFLTSPVEILGNGRVEAIRVVHNRIEADDKGRLRAVPAGEEEVIPCDIVLRSIGYRGVPLDDIPFDERRGLVRNEGGRVTAEDGAPHRGEYAVGWIKRGPSGVIGTNKKDAADTVARIVEDAEAGALNEPARPDADDVAVWIAERAPDAVTWAGWQVIDEHERRAGEPHGRPRVKLVRLGDLVAASKVGSTAG